jgi:hypothetical protein
MVQLIYALKKHNNWWFPTPSQPRISFERAILCQPTNSRYISILFYFETLLPYFSFLKSKLSMSDVDLHSVNIRKTVVNATPHRHHGAYSNFFIWCLILTLNKLVNTFKSKIRCIKFANTLGGTYVFMFLVIIWIISVSIYLPLNLYFTLSKALNIRNNATTDEFFKDNY